RDSLRASKIMQDRAKKNPKIHWIWNSTIVEVLGKEMVEGVRLKDVRTGKETEHKAQGVFVAIGHDPASQLVRGQLDCDETGYVKTDSHTRTSVPGVFAAGDVMDPHYRQAITAAGAGCMAALEAERFLAAHETVAA
ncbi:MAG: FAD-dependent oxidoreductase, partial [Elusimicrobia bacterium]|nr:FAD-dependent oxidoreductase [Elusimicrobiota bacterium]